jgi:hypothetical protein
VPRDDTHISRSIQRNSRAKTVLGAKTEIEAIERALALVVEEHMLDQPLKRTKGRMQLRKVFR